MINKLFKTIDWKAFELGLDRGLNVYVTGLIPHLFDTFIQKAKSELSSDFVYSAKVDSDIRKYLKTQEIFSKGKDSYSLNGLEYSLHDFGFKRVEKITSKGEWSRKGDIIALWPIEYSHPVRISYFGDDVESIEQFDEIYGKRVESINQIIFGNLNRLDSKVSWSDIKLSGFEKIDAKAGKVLFTSSFEKQDDGITVNLDYSYPNLYFKRFDILEQELKRLDSNGWDIALASTHKDELTPYLAKLLDKTGKTDQAQINELPAGFVSNSQKLIFLTDRELFGTIFLHKQKKALSSAQARKLLSKIEGEVDLDDYVVHEDHGVGIYKGLEQTKTTEQIVNVNFDRQNVEIVKEFLKIEYAAGDQLLVPFTQLHKITKYIGTANEEPLITRLHKGDWQSTIARTKKSIQLIARDLVEHYAKLQIAKIDGLEVTHSKEYKEFIEAFPYTETPDQLGAITDIEKDLASDKPMNRLIVGDVGFGKTEVAMRAAFRIVESGKQVAVLCPTTVLAAQHYKVFSDRFKKFGAKVSYVSRFNSASENKEQIEAAKTGEVDILVGTHRLLSNDIEFKNLGMIIIDEEQKFGVKQKEKIRKLQYNAHSLSMSATPIPRTLSMALSQIQEISIIATPPTNRQIVKTEVDKFNWNKIISEIDYEIKRGGQAYFLHNSVETIESIHTQLSEYMPHVDFVVGHGQMPGKQLDKVITEFYDNKHQVLICTTIIENGIDMPNVNTIIINDAQNFGLGQLYQLRGRVGRSDKQAFCYLYYKGSDLNESEKQVEKDEDYDYSGQKKSKKKMQVKKYIDRLKAIMEAQELGSGFKIASRDLEIRGAGNLLGEQQHGNIKNVGLALYMQLLAEEIERLKHL